MSSTGSEVSMFGKRAPSHLRKIGTSHPVERGHYSFVRWLLAILLLSLAIFGWPHLSNLLASRQIETRHAARVLAARYVLPVTFSSDGQMLAGGQGQVMAQLWIWDAQSGQLRHTIETNHNAAVWALTFSPDGKSVVSVGRDDGRLLVWDVQTGNKIGVLSGSLNTTESLFFSPDGNLLINAGSHLKPTIEVWNVRTKQLAYKIQEAEGSAFAAMLPDGKTFLTSSGGLTNIRDLKTGRVLRIVPTNNDRRQCFKAALSIDGKTMALGTRLNAGGAESVELWSVATGKLLNTSPENQGSGKVTWKSSLTALTFSPNAKLLASSSLFGTPELRLRDPQTGKVLRTVQIEAQSLAFSPDSTTLAVGVRNEVRLWKVDALLKEGAPK